MVATTRQIRIEAKALSGGDTPPNVGEVATALQGAMIAKKGPPDPIGWAVTRREDGRAIYMVAVVLGASNCDRMVKALTKAEPLLSPEDADAIFEDDADAA